VPDQIGIFGHSPRLPSSLSISRCLKQRNAAFLDLEQALGRYWTAGAVTMEEF